MQSSPPGSGLERALDAARRYVPGDGEPEIQAIRSGVANRTYSVTRGGVRHAMRIVDCGVRHPGIDREWECRVLRKMAPARLAPVVEACLPSDGVLVTRWVEGGFWTAAEVRRPESVAAIAMLVKKIHSVRAPVMARAMTPFRWIELYRGALSQRGALAAGFVPAPELDAQVKPLRTAYERCGPIAAALCHSDLHRHNLVHSGQGIVALDWEYAHVGDPFWDLAGWLAMNDLSGNAAEAMLFAYLGRAPMNDERRRLSLLMWFFDYVALLWIRLYAAARSGATPDEGSSEGLLQRADQLIARLAPGSDILT